jgi:hypothetical protein
LVETKQCIWKYLLFARLGLFLVNLAALLARRA